MHNFKNCVIHVSEANISVESGMGRIEHYWKQAFENLGFNFIHIGPDETRNLPHKSLFGLYSYKVFKRLKLHPVAIIAHEPVATFFSQENVPCFLESHGIERRNWNYELDSNENEISLKTKLFFPFWRVRPCDKGLKNTQKLLLSNSDDKNFAINYYNRSPNDIYMFKNGFEINSSLAYKHNKNRFTVLFNGTWIKRKGIDTLIESALILYNENIEINYLLIGTGKSKEDVLTMWPEPLRQFLNVIPFFKHKEESEFLNSSSVFVLPSFFEGQPLSLIQAMANGKCCITTNCCGQKDLIEHTKNGFLFEPGDSSRLAFLIKQCYMDSNIVSKIGEAAKKSVSERNWNIVSNELVNFVTSNLNT